MQPAHWIVLCQAADLPPNTAQIMARKQIEKRCLLVTMSEASTVAGPNEGCPSHCPNFNVARFSLPTAPTRDNGPGHETVQQVLHTRRKKKNARNRPTRQDYLGLNYNHPEQPRLSSPGQYITFCRPTARARHKSFPLQQDACHHPHTRRPQSWASTWPRSVHSRASATTSNRKT